MISYTYSITQDNSGLYMGSLLSPGSEDADPATIYQALTEALEMHHDDFDELVITEKDGEITISYPSDEPTETILRDCCDVVDYLNEFCPRSQQVPIVHILLPSIKKDST
ncbi:MAG: hypothetical protein C4291_11395 [Candidatus Dadabacteria bacterium]